MSNLVVERVGMVSVLKLDRPQKKNALTLAMYNALCDAFAAAEAEPDVRVVLIGSTSDAFTAGNDLMDFMQRPPSGEDSPVARFLTALRSFSKPLVAAVDGAAVGLGTTMLLHCDLVYATPRARLRLPFVNLGIVPEAASSLLLPHLVGMQRASEWLMLGDFIDVSEAHRAGLINAIVAPEELLSRAMATAEALASRPPEALRLTKKLLRDPMRAAVEATMQTEGQIFTERLRSPEAMAAMMAFMTRRG